MSALSSLSSLADQANMVIMPSLSMDITEDMQAMLKDLENLHDIQIDLSAIEAVDLTELNMMIRKMVDKELKHNEQ